jgi:hypothetical protein
VEQDYAVVLDGKVVNVVVWDGVSDWHPAAATTLVPLADYPNAGIGWDWDGTTFTDNRPVPDDD